MSLRRPAFDEAPCSHRRKWTCWLMFKQSRGRPNSNDGALFVAHAWFFLESLSVFLDIYVHPVFCCMQFWKKMQACANHPFSFDWNRDVWWLKSNALLTSLYSRYKQTSPGAVKDALSNIMVKGTTSWFFNLAFLRCFSINHCWMYQLTLLWYHVACAANCAVAMMMSMPQPIPSYSCGPVSKIHRPWPASWNHPFGGYQTIQMYGDFWWDSPEKNSCIV